MNMLKATFTYAVLLILLGLIGFLATGAASITALIPAFLGIVVLIFAFVGRSDNRRAMAMHIVAALALLGFLGTVTGIFKTITLITGGEVARPSAVISQAVMSLLSIGYLIPSVMSFIQARRARAAEKNKTDSSTLVERTQ